MIARLFIVLPLLLLQCSLAFLPGRPQTPPAIDICARRRQRFYAAPSADEMEELIVSLSREPTDDKRRKRMQDIFGTYNEAFCNGFERALIAVGDRVQREAAQEAKAVQQQEAEMPELLQEQKTETQFQLWALVDMMVQSKILIRKAKGE